MTTPRTPRPEPASDAGARPASRPAFPPPARDGTGRTIAVIALVVAGVALGLTVWRVLMPPGGGSNDCQARAWDVAPAEDQLPDGWVPSATQYDLSRKTMSFLGGIPTDDVSTQAVVYATITCFEQGADEAVKRSRDAAEAAGQTVTDRADLGDQSFSSIDESGAEFLQLRHGPVVVYLAASGDASPSEVDQLASAFDRALGGDGGAIASPAASASGDLAEESLGPEESVPAESQAAPELVAALPTKVGDVALVSDSTMGSTILGEDQGSRAILAALREAGREPDDLRVAQAYDEQAVSDLSLLAVTVDGMPVEKTQQLVLDSWLAASGSGVKRDTVTLDGKPWTRIDYGDDGTMDYVLAAGPNVIVITTADPELAGQAAAALP